ncbi:MAG: 50S ribosomal protein L3 N(5)-glutamine methyltransferase [Candidatus Obscuribacterales bacterium]|nr:50S ribosomal protein L3 N(5)-glutamine methyltransferase [Steroidobacteraceae bacterium]
MSLSVEQLIQRAAEALENASVYFGHGSDNAFDEAAELVFFVLGLRHEDAVANYPQLTTDHEQTAVLALVQQRIERRIPAAYLTQRMWFASHEFFVDERVLVPRSPIAELIEMHYAPWIDGALIHQVLDIGTGSGCIAVATALALPQVRVDAADVSETALAVTRINIDKHGLAARVRPMLSDVFDGVGHARYDLIVSNPPYVSAAELQALPAEYRREPELGLLAGNDGLSIVRRILAQAEKHLNPHGILVVEVGNTEEALLNAYPRVPFIWLEFERGGGGVFVLTAAQLAEHRKDLRLSAARVAQ